MKITKQGVRDLNHIKGKKPSNVVVLDYDARVQLEEEVADSLCNHVWVKEKDERQAAVFGKIVYRDCCKICGIPRPE